MKWMKAVLWSALLGATGAAWGSNTATDAPADYATGVKLFTPGSEQWYSLPLPLAVYHEAVWPDLRDIRVFNRQGDVVPFTLLAEKAQATSPKTIPLRLFPFDSTAQQVTPTQDDERPAVLLRSKNGIEIRFESENQQSIGQSYLIALPDDVKETPSLSQLRLIWDAPAKNWQGTASLYYSRDLRDWRLITGNAPLMDLTHSDDRLKMDTLGVDDLRMSADGVPWLLLILDSQSPAPNLSGVSGITREEPSLIRPVSMNAEAERIAGNQAIWRWSRPQPLTSLQVSLDNEGVLPVELEWRKAEKEAWQPLTRTVLYNLENQYSDDIPLSGELVEAVRMTTLQARLPATLPVLRGERDSYKVIFNAQGQSPFILAWGNKAAEPASISLAMLIPEALRKHNDPDKMSQAFEDERVTLGGEARLTATSVAEQQSQWKTLLVWGALILGVAVLALMAWRIWREVKKGNPT
ncbi:DUF3999 domain-containing protein [Citrobacter freundii]|uniref:DUF3999 domain-containing protein n=1 Tax=Citrobacter freundii TaxID=546 RepID=UPI0015E50CAF|nr:DUF3999 domain-containing protein [Citrobacter freundii]QLN90729.1 DUF3999 domain-containing protein [Citrobacter freundii]